MQKNWHSIRSFSGAVAGKSSTESFLEPCIIWPRYLLVPAARMFHIWLLPACRLIANCAPSRSLPISRVPSRYPHTSFSKPLRSFPACSVALRFERSLTRTHPDRHESELLLGAGPGATCLSHGEQQTKLAKTLPPIPARKAAAVAANQRCEYRAKANDASEGRHNTTCLHIYVGQHVSHAAHIGMHISAHRRRRSCAGSHQFYAVDNRSEPF